MSMLSRASPPLRSTAAMPRMISFLITVLSIFFFFNDTATTEIYTLSLHDALPISGRAIADTASRELILAGHAELLVLGAHREDDGARDGDRKSTRLNSSHLVISYAVFCLKKKKHKLISLTL